MQVADSGLVDVESERFAVFAKLNGKRQSNVAQTNDANDFLFVHLYESLNCNLAALSFSRTLNSNLNAFFYFVLDSRNRLVIATFSAIAIDVSRYTLLNFFYFECFASSQVAYRRGETVTTYLGVITIGLNNKNLIGEHHLYLTIRA